ncbi:hypothetical protein HBA_0240 [Sodalis endosymbiont of Henestaris halophilus]|nr:hypothetical protein HBA_0240 [Sodalis endosymbiont of Henestaris halophilus]
MAVWVSNILLFQCQISRNNIFAGSIAGYSAHKTHLIKFGMTPYKYAFSSLFLRLGVIVTTMHLQ